jgi:protein-S-isoprenylcysteine O-methyltransferase Ste14
MMQAHSYIVLALFSILGIALLSVVVFRKKDQFRFLGTPPIDKFLFLSGKITLFTNWGFFLFKALSPKSGYITVPQWLSWGAVGLLSIGSALMIIALFELGSSLRVGLPREATCLKTSGIYRFSRNPLYLGVYLITLASCLYIPDLVNVTFGLYGMYIHHMIAKSEEQFLTQRFGEEWKRYCSKTRRYF